MQHYGSGGCFSFTRMSDWFLPQTCYSQTQQQEPNYSCCFQHPLLTPCRLSRIDNWLCEQEPQPLTLFRHHNIRRISEPHLAGNCCFKRSSSLRRPTITNDSVCLSSPITHENHRRPLTPQNNLRNHLSRSGSCQSLSPRRQSSCNRSVRFGSCTSIDDAGCEKILYARPRESRFPLERARTRSCSRDSSVVRVISRSRSPCETFITASLPSRAAASAAVCCVDAGNQVKEKCSVGNSCNLGPICKPKPKGNIKYKCCVEKEKSTPLPPCECFQLPPPPSPYLCVDEEDKTEEIIAPCPDFSPPSFERYETTCRIERMTRSNVSRHSIRRFQSTERGMEVRGLAGSCDRSSIRYLNLMKRLEEDVKAKISECELDLAACEYMMSCDVSTFIQEVIRNSREFIRCELQAVRKICDSMWASDCRPTWCQEDAEAANAIERKLEQAWSSAQCKMHEITGLMDRVESLRCNGWQP